MQYRTLGRTGLRVSEVGVGGAQFGLTNYMGQWDAFSDKAQQATTATVHRALELGYTYFDTAPGYGNGRSEEMVGNALRGRRDQVTIATKVSGGQWTPDAIRQSVKASLRRLQTDVIDVIQFHGGMYTGSDVRHLLDEGLLDALCRLRERGCVRFIGFSVEEPCTALPLIATGRFDVMQVRYNLIYQSAALRVLDEARRADMGIAVMRPMTSGIFQRLAGYLAPEWHDARDLYEVCLKFVLSDSRVDVANVGMRWPEEVARNVRWVESFKPPFDMAELPRMTAAIYKTDDEQHPET